MWSMTDPAPTVVADAADRPRGARPPGFVILGVTALAVAVLVFLRADWWPGERNLTAADRLFFGAICAVSLVLTGTVWAVKTLYVVGRDRQWSRRIAYAPGVVVAGALAFWLWPLPDFESARPEFDAYVARLPSEPHFRDGRVRIGGFELSHVYRDDSGAVYFVDDDAALLSVAGGWVWSPDAVPVGYDDFTATDIGGGWYAYTAVWRD